MEGTIIGLLIFFGLGLLGYLFDHCIPRECSVCKQIKTNVYKRERYIGDEISGYFGKPGYYCDECAQYRNVVIIPVKNDIEPFPEEPDPIPEPNRYVGFEDYTNIENYNNYNDYDDYEDYEEDYDDCLRNDYDDHEEEDYYDDDWF